MATKRLKLTVEFRWIFSVQGYFLQINPAPAPQLTTRTNMYRSLQLEIVPTVLRSWEAQEVSQHLPTACSECTPHIVRQVA